MFRNIQQWVISQKNIWTDKWMWEIIFIGESYDQLHDEFKRHGEDKGLVFNFFFKRWNVFKSFEESWKEKVSRLTKTLKIEGF